MWQQQSNAAAARPRSHKVRPAFAFLVGHPALQALFGQFRFEHLPDHWVFVFELDLGAAFLDALIDAVALHLPRSWIFLASPADGEITRRRRARVEVLVKPALRRHHDAAV